jgi:hypothetical protein
MTSDPIIAAFEQQVGCYRQLAKLADLQHEHVRQSRTEQLLSVLQSRQDVLDQVASLEKVISPAKQRWSAYLGELDPVCRTKVEGLVSETRQLLEQITAADRDDGLVLQQRKLHLGRQIARTKPARQVNRNYAASAYGMHASKADFQQ